MRFPIAGSLRVQARPVTVAAPAIAGGVVTVVLAATVHHAELYADASPWSVALVLGAAGSLLAEGVARAWHRSAARAEEAARRADEAAQGERRRFLLRLDHELKNPITAMRAGLANLEAALPANAAADTKEVLANLEQQAIRLSGLIGDLRKISELETQPLALAPVQLTEVLEEVVAVTADQTVGRSVTLTVPKAPWPLPPVWGDRDLVFLAFVNLAANAIKFSAHSDTVEIRAADDPPWVVTEVADTGRGIPADETDLVWDELARGRTARGFPGTGMGLALVRTVIARHGGIVQLRSREAEGTVVTVKLPVAANVAELRHGGDPPATPAPYGPYQPSHHSNTIPTGGST